MVEAIRSAKILPDIPSASVRDAWIKDFCVTTFLKEGYLDRFLFLRVVKPMPAIIRVQHAFDYDEAYLGGEFCSFLAKKFAAQQLYLASESWYAQISAEEGDAIKKGKAPKVQPRHDPNRRESLFVFVEDPFRKPHLVMLTAEISRDAKGKPSLDPWSEAFEPGGGRLVQLLPPEAYIRPGERMPQS